MKDRNISKFQLHEFTGTTWKEYVLFIRMTHFCWDGNKRKIGCFTCSSLNGPEYCIASENQKSVCTIKGIKV